MNTFRLIIIIVVLMGLTITVVARSYRKGKVKSYRNPEPLYWKILCNIRTNEGWIKKELLLTTDPYEQGQIHFMAEALVEKYMHAMHYNLVNGYWIEEISPITEDQYQTIRKDLFVTLHGYSYE